jgi:Beta propeller domain
VYDATDPTKPALSAEHVILNSATSNSYTAAEYDFKSLRVVPPDPSDPNQLQLVAIPIESSDWQSGYRFYGYHTFLVNRTTIIKQCENGYVYNETQSYPQPVEDGSTGDGTTGSDGTTSDGSSSGSSGTGGDAAPTTPCYYCGYMAPRAMLFGTDLMTINNHFVRSHNVNTCAQTWALDILIQETSTWYGCCGAYW